MPQAIAYAAYSFVQAAGAIGISSATAVAALDTAIKVALIAGVNAAVQQNNEPEVQGGMVNLTINATEPRRLQVGKRINGGVLVDWYVRGSKNQNLYLVIYLGEGPQGALTRVTAGGRDVYTSTINHGVRTTIPDFRSGGDRLWITYYDGRPGQTADANLVSQGLGWTSNCIGDGCAYVIVECQWDEDNLTSPPSLGFETEGAKLYDRRLDTTAGGSGSHRLDNPATWALSTNPAVALDHFLLGRYTSNGTRAFGIGIDPDDVTYDRFEALANLCDESVSLSGGGTQKRYEANGFLFADRSNEDTIKDLCRAMNARPADFGGRVGILDGQSRSAVITLYDEDVIDTSAEQYRPKRAWAELVNEVRGTYISPTQNYQAADFPRVTDASWLAADNAEPRETTLNLEMEVSAERAQRLAWLHAMRERRQAQLSGVYHLKAIELEQGDWFVRAGGIFGAGKTFEVINRSLDPETFTVTITAFEVDAADTAWSTSIPSDPPPDGTPDASSLAAMEVPAITVTGITLSGTAADIPAIKVAWTAPSDPAVRQILIEYAPTGGDVASTLVDADAGSAVFTNGITDDTDYLARARFIGAGLPSDWTSAYSLTTLGDYAVGVALTLDGQGSGATANSLADLNSDDAAALDASALSARRLTAQSEVGWNLNSWVGLVNDATRGPVIESVVGNSVLQTQEPIKIGPNEVWIARWRVYAVSESSGTSQVRFGYYSHDASGTAVQSNIQTPSITVPIGTYREETIAFVGSDVTDSFDVDQTFVIDTSGGAVSFIPHVRNYRGVFQVVEVAFSGPHRWGAWADEAEARTSQGVADSVNGQGDLATRNDVATSHIQTGAVSVAGAAETAASLTVTDSWKDAQSVSVSVPADAEFVVLQWQMIAQALGLPSHNNSSQLEVRLLQAGSAIWGPVVVATLDAPYTVYTESGGVATISSQTLILPGNFKGVVNGFDLVSALASGTVTYKAQVRRAAGAGSRATWSVSDRKLLASVAKR